MKLIVGTILHRGKAPSSVMNCKVMNVHQSYIIADTGLRIEKADIGIGMGWYVHGDTAAGRYMFELTFGTD